MVALPQLVYQQGLLPQCEVPIVAAPLLNAFPAVANHLGRNVGKKPINSPPVLGNHHGSGADLANGRIVFVWRAGMIGTICTRGSFQFSSSRKMLF